MHRGETNTMRLSPLLSVFTTLALFFTGGGDSEAPHPLRLVVCHCHTVGDRELKLPGFYGTFIETFRNFLAQGQVRLPGQVS